MNLNKCECTCMWCERKEHDNCGFDCSLKPVKEPVERRKYGFSQNLRQQIHDLITEKRINNNEWVLTDLVLTLCKQEMVEPGAVIKAIDGVKKDMLDKIWNMKYREISNHESIDNYNNKKLGYYACIKEIKQMFDKE